MPKPQPPQRTVSSVLPALIALRKAQGITQSEMSVLLGVKQPNLSRIEAGVNVPSINFITAYAYYLHHAVTLKPFSTPAEELKTLQEIVDIDAD